LPELFVIVQILIAQCQTVDPLGDQLFYGVFHQQRIAPVEKALRQPWQQIQALVGFPQQQPTAIGGYRSPIESGHHFSRKMGCKLER